MNSGYVMQYCTSEIASHESLSNAIFHSQFNHDVEFVPFVP